MRRATGYDANLQCAGQPQLELNIEQLSAAPRDSAGPEGIIQPAWCGFRSSSYASFSAARRGTAVPRGHDDRQTTEFCVLAREQHVNRTITSFAYKIYATKNSQILQWNQRTRERRFTPTDCTHWPWNSAISDSSIYQCLLTYLHIGLLSSGLQQQPVSARHRITYSSTADQHTADRCHLEVLIFKIPWTQTDADTCLAWLAAVWGRTPAAVCLLHCDCSLAPCQSQSVKRQQMAVIEERES